MSLPPSSKFPATSSTTSRAKGQITPLTENTTADPEFAEIFQFFRPRFEDTEFNGFAVRGLYSGISNQRWRAGGIICSTSSRGTVTPKDMAIVGAIVFVTVVLFAGFYFILYTGQQEKLTGIEGGNRSHSERSPRRLQHPEKYRGPTHRIRQNGKTRRPRSKNASPINRKSPACSVNSKAWATNSDSASNSAMLQNEKDGRKVTIPYDVVARGSFHQIVNFINLLERDDRYLKISDLESEKRAGVSEANFTLSAFALIWNRPQQGRNNWTSKKNTDCHRRRASRSSSSASSFYQLVIAGGDKGSPPKIQKKHRHPYGHCTGAKRTGQPH